MGPLSDTSELLFFLESIRGRGVHQKAKGFTQEEMQDLGFNDRYYPRIEADESVRRGLMGVFRFD